MLVVIEGIDVRLCEVAEVAVEVVLPVDVGPEEDDELAVELVRTGGEVVVDAFGDV